MRNFMCLKILSDLVFAGVAFYCSRKQLSCTE